MSPAQAIQQRIEECVQPRTLASLMLPTGSTRFKKQLELWLSQKHGQRGEDGAALTLCAVKGHAVWDSELRVIHHFSDLPFQNVPMWHGRLPHAHDNYFTTHYSAP